MSKAFTVLWTHETCRALRREGRVGERPPVAFSGVHTSRPKWSAARPGDQVFALHVKACVVYLVSGMRIIDKQRRYCCGLEPATYRDPAFPGHADWAMLGARDCGAAPVHVAATPVRFDVPVPREMLERFTFRGRQGIRSLKHLTDGRLTSAVGLLGFYRLTDETAADLAGLAGGL
jgi:hypothetical protein